MHSRRHTSSTVVGLLDVGSSKICCLVAERQPPVPGPAGEPAPMRLLGIGLQRAHGIKSGVVTDLDQAEQAIRSAVSQAERMAGVELGEVHLAAATGRLKSHNFSASVPVTSRSIHDGDIARLIRGARAYAEREGRSVVYLKEIGYRVGAAEGVHDPRGMVASEMAADFHAVTADDGALRNLLLAVERCHLRISGLVPAPLASGLAVTTEEERRLGIIVIDIGAGVTSLAIFAEGHFLFCDTIPVGSQHITFDIARALSTPVAEAERIKTLYGTLIKASSDDRELITFPVVGGGEADLFEISRSQLLEIVAPRVDSILALADERLKASSMTAFGGGRVVLTGGASQLIGLGQHAAERLMLPCRVGRPAPLAGMAATLCSPAFAAVIGMAEVASGPPSGVRQYEDRRVLGGTGGYVGRVGQWFRESF